MSKNRKLKKNVKIFIAAAVIVLAVSIVLILINRNNKPAADQGEDSGSQAQLIENEGNIEIIIPEDQESDGF